MAFLQLANQGPSTSVTPQHTTESKVMPDHSVYCLSLQNHLHTVEYLFIHEGLVSPVEELAGFTHADDPHIERIVQNRAQACKAEGFVLAIPKSKSIDLGE